MSGSAAEVLSEGDLVAGRYVVEERIGKGGMGAVHAARDQRLGRRVALKALASRWVKGKARQRLEDEARAVAALAHEGIVTLFDVVEHDDELVLVMELVSGESLRSALGRGPLPIAEVTSLVSKVADALGAAHELGFVHRDVKPDNIVLRANGKTKLLDFGIATAAADSGLDPAGLTVSADEKIVGTPAYLSPEQIQGTKVTAATDQFALGVTAYELLTGQLPWRTANLGLLVSDILGAIPAPMASHREAIPEPVEQVLRRALEKEPPARFATVRDFADALVAAAAGFADTGLVERRAASFDAKRTPQHDPYTETRVTPQESAPPRGDDAAPAPTPTPTLDAAGPRRRWITALVGVIGVAVVATLFASRPAATPGSAPSATVAASSAAPSASAKQLLADLPPSQTANDEARSKYVEGVAALGLGVATARDALDAAIRADPSFASALLQRAYDSFRRAAALDEPGRAALRGAVAHRANLSARDGELLDAMLPAFGDPPDWASTGARLEAFVAKRPQDEQGWDALAMTHVKRGDYERAELEYARVLELDPKATIAYLIRAQIHLVSDQTAAGREMLTTCLRAVPEAQRCRLQLAISMSHAGECAEAERVAREMTALVPDNPQGYAMRAQAAAGLEAPEDAIGELLRRERDAMAPSVRPVRELLDGARLAVRRGDFDAATDELAKASEIIGTTDDELLMQVVVRRVAIEWEAGRASSAAKIAAAFVDRSATRKAPERISRDGTPQLLGAMFEGGLLDRDALVARRDAWIRSWRSRTDASAWKEGAPLAWMNLFGLHEPNAADVVDAMKVRAEHHAVALRVGDPNATNALAHGGSLLLAAGELAEAERLLRSATRTCTVDPDMRAIYLLGVTLQKKGDTEGACEAFAHVQRRWGTAKPTSVTARAARKAAADCRRK